MYSIFISLICSVSVGVVLKIAKRYDITFMQIIGWNYLIALLLAKFFFIEDINSLSTINLPLIIVSTLWVLMPVVFLVQAWSLHKVGIVKTDIAQRLSLFIPILASYYLFDEVFSPFKIIGLIVAFIAIFFTLNKAEIDKNDATKWQYPLFVLLGFGVIDVLFKMIVSTSLIPFTTTLFVVFCGAFVLTWLYNTIQMFMQKQTFSLINIYWGIALGLLNFGNIYFYLRAHKELSENPSTVFATMNLGVIILGSFIGVLFFKEKLNKINYFGIVLAMVAVVLIVISQLYP